MLVVLTEISYVNGTSGGIIPWDTYHQDFECVNFTIAFDCTLKSVNLFSSGSGSFTVHVYADAGGGPDLSTEFGTGFSATATNGTWTETNLPSPVFLTAGEYWVGWDRPSASPSIPVDTDGATDERSLLLVDPDWYLSPGDYLFRIKVKSIGSSVPTVTSYNIKRSTSIGGPFSNIGSAFTESYTDLAVTDDIPYYYMVSAIYDGTHESSNSNIAMGQPSSSVSTVDTLIEFDTSPAGFIYSRSAGMRFGQLFHIDTPVQILEIGYYTGGTGYFEPTIHPYSGGRVQNNILPSFRWATTDGGWSIIDLEGFGGTFSASDFIVAFGTLDSFARLGYDEATGSDCWVYNGTWGTDDDMQYFIYAIVRELDTTETYSLSGTVRLSPGSGGSSSPSDLSGSVVRVLGTDIVDTTAVDGSYRIEGISPGINKIKVSHNGYESNTVDIGFDGDQFQDFSLFPIATPLNSPQDFITRSYLDGVVPMAWTPPIGAPGTWQEMSYNDGVPRLYHRLDRGDISVQHFTVHFPCTLMYSGILFYDSTGTYTNVSLHVWADDGEGYPDFSNPLSDSIVFTPDGYPSWDVTDLRTQRIVLDAGSHFHIGVKQLGVHSFVVSDSFAPARPSRSKIYLNETRTWNDSVPDFFLTLSLNTLASQVFHRLIVNLYPVLFLTDQEAI